MIQPTLFKQIPLLVGLFLLLFALNACAQSDNYQFRHLGESDGLPDNRVRKVFQDSRGYMWFGTHDGLARWDGLMMQTFLPDNQDSLAIAGSIIMDILEDKEGYIWIVSHQKGIARFDHTTETFTNYIYPTVLNSLTCMTQDAEGVFWIGSYASGLYRFVPYDEVSNFSILKKYENGEEAFRRNSTVDIIEDKKDNNILRLAGNDGYYVFNKKEGSFSKFHSAVSAEMTVNALKLTQSDTLWLATYGGGMVHFDMVSDNWKYHVYDKENWKKRNGFKNVVMDFAEKSEREFWIASLDKGSGIFNKNTGQYTFFRHNEDDPNSIKSNQSLRVYKDQQNRVWFAHEKRGVSYVDLDCQAFYLMPLKMDYCSVQSANNVTDFGFDQSANTLYAAANACDGLYAINPQNWNYEVIPMEGFEGQYQIYSTILVTKKRKIWLGGRHSKGTDKADFKRPSLLYLDKTTNKLLPFQHPRITELGLQQRNIIDFHEDEKENLWIATDDGSLVKIDFKTDEITEFSLDAFKSDSNQVIGIDKIIATNNQYLWVATSKGLFNFNFSTQKFEHFEKTALFDIKAIALDDKGLIWMGTKQNGLQVLNPQNPDAVYIPNIANLPRTPIDKIVFDKQKQLWLTTQKGIYLYDQAANRFETFSVSEGLTKNLFFQHGFFELSDSVMLAGNYNGYYVFNPQKLTRLPEKNELTITEYNLKGKSYEGIANQLNQLDLKHNENFFDFAFSTQCFCGADKVGFTYRMKGLNQDWVTTELGKHRANYTAIAPGQYQFQVQRTNYTDTLRTIDITIHPPWWNTWLAWAAYAAIFLFAFKRYQKNQLDKQLLQKESQQLKKWNDNQTKLYANITHEFRTPLTIVMGLAGQIEQETLDTKVAQKALSIQHNGQRFLSLINQILDLEKAKEGKFELNMVQKEIKGLLVYTHKNLQPLATNKQVKLVSQIDFDSLIMDHDADKLITILSNLLANAIKFTPEDGTIFYRAKKQGNNLSIEVEDTGIGIDPEFQNRIFERYFNLDLHTGKAGTGIGLSLSNELVQLMGGTIEVISEKGKGSIFRVILPISRKATTETTAASQVLQNPSSFTKTIVLPTSTVDDKDKPIVLVIEDNLEITNLVASILGKHYQIHFAKDGQEGIEQAIKIIPDLVISDVMMPKKDGYEVCETLKLHELTSHIPIVLLTAKVEQKDKITGLKTGADDYLTKPFHPEELFLRVNNAIQTRSFLKERYANLETFTERPKSKSPIEGIDLDMQDAFVKKLLCLFEKNISNSNYSSGSIHVDLGLSRTQAYRKIKALTKFSPGNFLRLYRLSRAKVLLDTTDMNITEVAYETGFQDSSYFSRAFKEAFDITPSVFKETTTKTER